VARWLIILIAMKLIPKNAAEFSMNALPNITLSGAWLVSTLHGMVEKIHTIPTTAELNFVADGSGIEALDMSGAWVMQSLLSHLHAQGKCITLKGFKPEFAERLKVVTDEFSRHANAQRNVEVKLPTALEHIGMTATTTLKEAKDLLSFVGEVFFVLVTSIAHPLRIRWRPILFNIREAGFLHFCLAL
jgi:phospholipid/cholesterol/gamma-HCH transport system permease protein